MLKPTAILAPLFFSAHLSAQTWIEDAQGQRYLLGDQLVSTTTEAYNYCTSKGLTPANVAQMRRALRQGKVTVDFVSVAVSEDAKTPFIKDKHWIAKHEQGRIRVRNSSSFDSALPLCAGR